LAGLTSTIEAVRSGATVTLFEKESYLGGNSAKATSGINGVCTNCQKTQGISDSYDLFDTDTMKAGLYLNNKNLVQILGSKSNETIEWLRSFGLDLSKLVQCGGHSVKRTLRVPEVEDKPSAIGWNIISTLKKYIETELDVTIKLNHRLVDMKVDGNGLIIHVSENQTQVEVYSFDSVILSTGGYSASKEYLAKYAKDKLDLSTTNGKFATGDGLTIAQKVGGILIDMDKVQIHPTAFIDLKDFSAQQKFLAPEALRGHGAIMFNKSGKRFANELGTRDYLTKRIFEFGETENKTKYAYLLLDQEMAIDFGENTLNFYAKRGLFHGFDTLDDVGKFVGCDLNTLKDTLVKYGKSEDEFGKVNFPRIFNLESDSRYYVSLITPSVHYTMGGLAISGTAEVINGANGETVKGLYAVGEVSGGVHGGNRLAGNSLLECVVFGRIAGRRAAKSHLDLPVFDGIDFLQLEVREVWGSSVRFNFVSQNQCSGLLEKQKVISRYLIINGRGLEGDEEFYHYQTSEKGYMDVDLGPYSNRIKPGDVIEFRVDQSLKIHPKCKNC
jgi:cleavage and polyadenylation specificity factor subunit 2